MPFGGSPSKVCTNLFGSARQKKKGPEGPFHKCVLFVIHSDQDRE